MSRPLRITCLHSAAVNEGVFAEAARVMAPTNDLAVSHDTGAIPLLLEAEARGGMNADIAARTAALIDDLVDGSDVVLLTCSTLGLGAEIAAQRTSVPVLRVDKALAEAAVTAGRRILVLYAVATTLEPTRQLFEQVAEGHSVTITYELVPDAWQAFRAGDRDGYHRIVAEYADRAVGDDGGRYDVVALAQASMSGAATLTRHCTPLTSPAAGLAAAIVASGLR